MIATMIRGDPDPEDLRKFFRAFRPAQRDPDLRPDRFTHYYRNKFSERFHADGHPPLGPGERPVFEAYTREAHAETRDGIARHGIFARRRDGARAVRRFGIFAAKRGIAGLASPQKMQRCGSKAVQGM